MITKIKEIVKVIFLRGNIDQLSRKIDKSNQERETY